MSGTPIPASSRPRQRQVFAIGACAMPVCMYCGSGTLCDADHGIPAGGDGCLKAAAFFNELKRRNVLRAGTFYVAAAWALSQGLAQLLPVFNAPNWITQWFVIACVIGFPFWVTFAWFYEFTPTGLKLESEIAPGDSIQEHTGKRADRWIIATLSVAVVLLITNTFVLHRDANSQADVADAKAIAATLAKVPKQSVAVLPFGNESGDPKQQYFSDGLSEELISELTQVNGLKVIGKYSSFKFRDSKDSPAQIGAALEVANLIQGSVFQQGNQIRVTVGMIRARDGASLWSHSYDEELCSGSGWCCRPRSSAPAQSAGTTRESCQAPARSEERRVGKECRSRWSPYH